MDEKRVDLNESRKFWEAFLKKNEDKVVVF